MAEQGEQKTSAQLEREVEAQRDRVETSINEIQDRLSPGQMVDELLNYAKNSGGGDFVANLGRNVSGNPLPVALMGISLLWLIAKPVAGTAASKSDRTWQDDNYSDAPYDVVIDDDDYGYAAVESPVRRIGHVTDEVGERYGEFVDGAGRKFRALADTAGNRAGHFKDDAGNTFRGFRNAAGDRIDDIRDEAGAALDSASGWASDTWRKASHVAQRARDGLTDGRDQLQQRAVDAGTAVRDQTSQAGQTLMNVLHDQPLVGGALAFAVGAAIASAFPHTRQEDEVFGEAADNLKQQAGEVASDVYDKGKDKAAEIYSEVAEKTADVYQHAKDDLAKPSSSPAPGN